jgi:hypothetical protein
MTRKLASWTAACYTVAVFFLAVWVLNNPIELDAVLPLAFCAVAGIATLLTVAVIICRFREVR